MERTCRFGLATLGKVATSIVLASFFATVFLLQIGCSTTKGVGFDYERTLARFVIEQDARESYAKIVELPVSKARIPIQPRASLSEFDIVNVEVAQLELGQCLLFSLTRSAAMDFYRISAQNIGKRIVLLLNGQPIGVRRIDGPIAEGTLYIFLETPDSNLEQIATNLKGTSIEIQKKLQG